MNTQEFKLFAFGEMKELYGEPIYYEDFEELYRELDIDDQLSIGTKFGESKALLEQSRILKHA